MLDYNYFHIKEIHYQNPNIIPNSINLCSKTIMKPNKSRKNLHIKFNKSL